MNEGEAHGRLGVDHVWRRQLQSAIDATELPGSLDDALRPLAAMFSDEINAKDLQAAVDGQREQWRACLHGAAEDGGLDLPAWYELDWAVVIYVYTLADPKVFKVVNREMRNRDQRQAGGGGGISDGLRACLPFVRLLLYALEKLPERYVYRGEVRRGVKYVYPSPARHNPEAHFRAGQHVMWYEFKSTSERQEVMMREHFCGAAAGPRTIFVILVCRGFSIKDFSSYRGEESEYEVLLLPFSEFEVLSTTRNIIDPA
jgi:hypothetical protein